MRLTALPHRLALAAVLFLGLAAPALADPPDRVGRLSYVEGQVSFRAPEQDQWMAASLNFPIIAGDVLWTNPQSRAEIQMGPAELRLDEQTELTVLRLDDEAAQVQLDQGAINLHLNAVPLGGLQVVTAAGRVDLLRPGSYHVDAGVPGPDGRPGGVAAIAFAGEARFLGPRTAVDLLAGQGAVIGPDLSSLTMVNAGIGPFDAWAVARDREEAAAVASQYVSPETTGYQDLDAYGQWTAVADYGPVWIPSVGPDWAPYRYGHWAFVQPWGWTWMDDAPWGFAPFHYGRWVDLGGRWGWYPGRPVQRPVYAPALVAFLGAPGATAPSVGWVPLAPHEPFHPYYAASDAYLRRVNANHLGNPAEVDIRHPWGSDYANRRAATAVPSAAFTAAAPVHRSQLQLPPQQLGQAPVIPNLGHLQPQPPTHPGAAGPAPAAARPVPEGHPEGSPGHWENRSVPAPQAPARPQPPQPQPQPSLQQLQRLPQQPVAQPQPQPPQQQLQRLPQQPVAQPQPQPPQQQLQRLPQQPVAQPQPAARPAPPAAPPAQAPVHPAPPASQPRPAPQQGQPHDHPSGHHDEHHEADQGERH